MRRLVDKIKRYYNCCPGHDDFPTETYNSRRSKKARARDRGKENRYARRKLKQNLEKDQDQ